MAVLAITVLTQTALAGDVVNLEYFYGTTCPDCAQTTPIIDEIEQEYGNNITVERLDVSILENWERWDSYDFVEVPAVVVNYETKLPIDEITKENLETVIDNILGGGQTNESSDQNIWIVDTPFGKFNVSELSLPALTIILGGLDSLNPCSFWVLLFLLSLLLYVQSRKRILLIGGIFIFFSGFIYFLFMSVLVGIFIITGQQPIITIVAGIFALLLGGINIKDFFFKKGPSLSIPESKKPELFKKMRQVVKSSHFPSMIIGTIMLAIFANTYELFCTLGLPLTFTRILTLYNLPSLQYYLYIFFYNVVYIIPLLIIVLTFAMTFGRLKLTERQGRVLKLFSGLMMFLLGIVLIALPDALTNVFPVIIIPLVAVLTTAVVSLISKRYEKPENEIVP